MPPKNASKAGNKESKKTENKKKEKVIEDKTFGLKNKKGAKQQKFIQQVQHQVKNAGMNKNQRLLEKEKEDAKKEKEAKKLQLAQINQLLKPVQDAAKGADPKTVLCAFFKQGTCGKGAKCKFSHDLSVERKAAKRSVYCDLRDDKETNEEWNEEKLKQVIDEKHGKEVTNQTSIVCKYFIEAVENNRYGWFWQCVNGDDCKYRHALPLDYVLKRDRKKMEKSKDTTPIEEIVEKERAALGSDLTPITLKAFLEWKKKRVRDKEATKKKTTDKKEKITKKPDLQISGREMFQKSMVNAAGDEDTEEGEEGVDLRREEGEEEKKEWENAIDYDEELKKYKAMEKDAEASVSAAEGQASGGVAIDEELFDEDLDDLDEDFNELDVN